MLLKNHLIEVFKKASLENNILVRQNIVFKWVHRFGIDSLNDLLIHNPALREYQYNEKKQEQITLMSEVDDEENQEQVKLELLKTFENIEETKWESNRLKTLSSNAIFSKDQNSNNIKQLNDNKKLPLPNIKNLRKWIKNDKKAS
jgi:hypothetical protein